MLWNNNPLAPAWLRPGFACRVGDRFFQYVLAATVPANSSLIDQPFLFDGGECFIWRSAASYALNAGGDNQYLHLRDHNGRYLSNQPLAVPGWAGLGGQHCPIVPEEMIPSGAFWSYSAFNGVVLTAGQIFFMLSGAKRRSGQ